MFKLTPNPPDTDDVSPYEAPDSKKLNEAADRALDYYLKPVIPKDTPPPAQYHLHHRPRHRSRNPAGQRL